MDYPARVRQELKVRCTHLRTKQAYMPLPQAGDHENDVPTAIWWCALTHAQLGPDGSAAGCGDCDRPGRPCYRPPHVN
jgi:hypothetical protein